MKKFMVLAAALAMALVAAAPVMAQEAAQYQRGLLDPALRTTAPRVAEGTAPVKVCGSGFGHGVGLSQWGAYGRAKAGQKYDRILKAYYQGVALQRFATDPTVRVLLAEKSLDAGHDVVVGSGSQARLRNLATNATVPLGPSTYMVQYLPAQALYRVSDASTGQQLGTYRGPITFEYVSGAPLGYAGKTYRGALEANVSTSNSKSYLVNRLALEAYLRGVVPNEMPASWHLEALKSQAVAARSYALATRGGVPFADFYADTRDQVYNGASSESTATNNAVSATARVAAVHGGQPIVAYFSSSNGGHAEDATYVFGSYPYLKAVRDADPAGANYEARVNSPWTRWSGAIDPNGSPQLGVGSIVVVRVLASTPSGRATEVEVTGTTGTKVITGQYGVRQGLKSTGLVRADGSSFPAGALPSARVNFGSACG